MSLSLCKYKYKYKYIYICIHILAYTYGTSLSQALRVSHTVCCSSSRSIHKDSTSGEAPGVEGLCHLFLSVLLQVTWAFWVHCVWTGLMDPDGLIITDSFYESISIHDLN